MIRNKNCSKYTNIIEGGQSKDNAVYLRKVKIK